VPDSCTNCQNSDHLHRNPANQDSDETVWILAFIPEFDNSSLNQVKVAGILPVNDGISPPVIFILFYIILFYIIYFYVVNKN
jgi:hypothetical protein